MKQNTAFDTVMPVHPTNGKWQTTIQSAGETLKHNILVLIKSGKHTRIVMTRIVTFHYDCDNVQFQKISMPTPRKVNGNSTGGGGFQKPNFCNKSMTTKWNFWRGGGFNLKNLPWEGYGYFLEQHNSKFAGQLVY